MNILVSACLLGVPCRYDGRSVTDEAILKLLQKHWLIPVCSEIMGGLATPRAPAERVGERVLTKNGEDVTQEYLRGAEEILRLGRLYGCKCAILKEKSPSCGAGRIYDGSFTRALTEGYGVTAELLMRNGITVLGESEISRLDTMEV